MDKKGIKVLGCIIFLHLLWFAGGMIWKSFYNGDSYEYIYLAENIRHGFYYGANALLPIVDYGLSSRTPLYSLLLLLNYTLFGLHNLPIFIFQNILSIASCWMIYGVFRKLFPEQIKGWIYILLIAFYPAQLFFATMLVPDTLLQFFLMLYCKELLFSLETPSPGRLAKMGLWLILATMTKPIVYPFLILHIGFSIWYFYKTRMSIVLLLGIIPFLSIIGYGFWNKSRTGLYHISSVQSQNLLNFNARSFLTFKYGNAYSDSVLDHANAGFVAQKGLKNKYEFADKAAKTIIKNDLKDYALYHLKESGRFFIEPGKIELDMYVGYANLIFNPKSANFYSELKKDGIKGAWNYLKGYPYLPLILLIVLFNLIRIWGWLLFLFDKRYALSLKVVTTIYILYFAVVTGPVSNTRYFMTVLLIMSALSSLGFAGLINKRKARKQTTLYAS
jgi:hypothetical protein